MHYKRDKMRERKEDYSRKILFIILFIIVLISILGTWTILQIVEGPKANAIYYEHILVKEPPSSSGIGLTILPPQKEQKKSGE